VRIIPSPHWQPCRARLYLETGSGGEILIGACSPSLCLYVPIPQITHNCTHSPKITHNFKPPTLTQTHTHPAFRATEPRTTANRVKSNFDQFNLLRNTVSNTLDSIIYICPQERFRFRQLGKDILYFSTTRHRFIQSLRCRDTLNKRLKPTGGIDIPAVYVCSFRDGRALTSGGRLSLQLSWLQASPGTHNLSNSSWSRAPGPDWLGCLSANGTRAPLKLKMGAPLELKMGAPLP